MNNILVMYFKVGAQKGFSYEQMRDSLRKQRYDDKEIKEAYDAMLAEKSGKVRRIAESKINPPVEKTTEPEKISPLVRVKTKPKIVPTLETRVVAKIEGKKPIALQIEKKVAEPEPIIPLVRKKIVEPKVEPKPIVPEPEKIETPPLTVMPSTPPVAWKGIEPQVIEPGITPISEAEINPNIFQRHKILFIIFGLILLGIIGGVLYTTLYSGNVSVKLVPSNQTGTSGTAAVPEASAATGAPETTTTVSENTSTRPVVENSLSVSPTANNSGSVVANNLSAPPATENVSGSPALSGEGMACFLNEQCGAGYSCSTTTGKCQKNA